ncbi:hypothetical protein os4_08920 [Comamonadaceae bacterium OS-4]|nr:hypothetical protein os4_08920 [Comamonadaceae bacterium OS-4]
MTFAIAKLLGYKQALNGAIAITFLIGAGASQAETPIPIANFTSYTDQALSSYLAENLNSGIKAEIDQRKLAVFAITSKFDGKKACYAMVGLTQATPKDRNPRLPAYRFSAFQTQTDGNWAKGDCVEEELKSAIEKMNNASLSTVLDGIDSTASPGGVRKIEPPSTTTAQLYAEGITKENKQSLFDIIHRHEFGAAFDYRYVQSAIYAAAIQFSGGDSMCVAFAGVTGRSPDSRSFRWPGYTTGYVRLQKGGDIEACKRLVAEVALGELLNEEWTSEGLLDNFSASREDGIPLPQAQNSRTPKPLQKSTTSTTRQVKRSSCTNDCVNGSCLRRFPDGTTERWKAQRKFNPFNSNWEWDTTTNACGL